MVVDLDALAAEDERRAIRQVFDTPTWSVGRQTMLSVELVEWGPEKQQAAVLIETFTDREGGESRRYIYIPENIRDEVADIIRRHIVPPPAPDEAVLRERVMKALSDAAMVYPPDAVVTCFNLDRAVADAVMSVLAAGGREQGQ